MIVTLLVLECLTGCVSSPNNLPVRYEATGIPNTVAGSDGKTTLFFPTIEDRRTGSIRSLNTCFQGGGLTFQTDRPPAVIVHEALTTELSVLGVGVTPLAGGAQGTLRGQLKKFEVCQDDGSYQVETHVELYGTDGESLWAGDLYGRTVHSSGSSLSADFERNLTTGFSQALTEAVQKLNQPGFLRALKSLARESPALPSGGASPPPPVY